MAPGRTPETSLEYKPIRNGGVGRPLRHWFHYWTDGTETGDI